MALELGNAKIIYLDQNMWILLAREYYGIESDSIIKKVLCKLENNVKSGNIILPLSFHHIDETIKRGNVRSRMQLANLMIDLSRNIFIAPHMTVIEAEIRNAILRRIGRNPIDLKNLAFGKGVHYSLGVEAKLYRKPGTTGPNLGDQKKKEIMEYVNSPDEFLRIISDQSFRKVIGSIHKQYDEAIEKMEKNRIKAQSIKDNNFRYRVAIVNFLLEYIGPILYAILKEENLTFTKILNKNMKREEMNRFFQDIPSAYCSFILTNRRDSNIQRQIHPHDISDIGFLSMVIPYCNIVVTESMWSTIGAQTNLDRLYQTKILSSVTDLLDYL